MIGTVVYVRGGEKNTVLVTIYTVRRRYLFGPAGYLMDTLVTGKLS